MQRAPGLPCPGAPPVHGLVRTYLSGKFQALGRDWSSCLVSQRKQLVLEARTGVLSKVAPRSLVQGVFGVEV